MNIGGSLVVFGIAWWIAFIAVLPWGVRSQAESGDVTEGTDPGAPTTPQLGRKAIAATIIAVIVWAALFATIEFRLLTLDDFPYLPDFVR